ncbi:uncharacterized protein LOC114518237 isoform X2 [Dendronephthya gigantea]|uniref:uncharacterized protein LOC114518237 isoform X2 n=1 Tax=Dendronephthya gigantea TaxID=151771 RepID=UPI00106C5772|nr:uncharacterized protein LOC114518237 isoform X2 [Dendronephthya gigantea]
MAVLKTISLLIVLAVFLKYIHGDSSCSERQRDGSVCPRSKRIEIHFKPYYEIFFDKTGSRNSLYPDILRNASATCCKSSVLEFIPVNSSTKDIEELIQDESCTKVKNNDSSLSFFFPVFVKSGKKAAFDDDFQFVQLAKSAGPVIMMLTSEKQKMKVTASVAVRNSWPLFVLIMCLSATVGLLGWLLDHSSNPSQFSTWFYKGAWEGFWWAMVTITTVGYGDKVPVAFFSRVLTILWLFCGAIILSLFTANVTSVLTSNQMDFTKDLIGTRIAVLNSKHYFESNLNVGGTIEEFNSQDAMFAAVESGDVDRILVQNYFYIHRLKEGEEKMKLFSVVDVVHEPFLTGLAMVNKLSNDNKAFLSCLRKKVKSYNRFHVSSKDAIMDEKKDSLHKTSMLFEHDILLIIYYNLIAIGVIAGIGVFLDLFRCLKFGNRRKKRGLDSDDIEESEMKSLDREANV